MVVIDRARLVGRRIVFQFGDLVGGAFGQPVEIGAQCGKAGGGVGREIMQRAGEAGDHRMIVVDCGKGFRRHADRNGDRDQGKRKRYRERTVSQFHGFSSKEPCPRAVEGTADSGLSARQRAA